MKLLVVLCFTVAASAQAPLQPVSGSISGVLTGDDGGKLQGGSVILHLVAKKAPKLRRQTSVWTSTTDGGGAFQFQDLPEGNFTLCPSVPNSTWLNPCEWNFPAPAVTITRQVPAASLSITLKRGAAVPIRIEDPGQVLAKNEGKTPGAGFLLEILDPGSFFRLVPLVSQDAGGRNHQIIIPFNTSLTLFVHPTSYRVADAIGVALAQSRTTKIPLLVTTGQQVSPIKFTITGVAK